MANLLISHELFLLEKPFFHCSGRIFFTLEYALELIAECCVAVVDFLFLQESWTVFGSFEAWQDLFFAATIYI